MKLSIVVIGRNDNHSGNFVERLCAVMKWNLIQLEHLNYTYEYVVVDWCSDSGNELYTTEQLQDLSKEYPIKHIIVSKELAIRRYCSDRFYQFFAKNVGIRHCDGEWVLLINADNMLHIPLIENINKVINEDNANDFYRIKWWKEINTDGEEVRIVDCDSGATKGIAEVYSGDFLLCKKETIVEKGRGYDESNQGHYTELPQAQMDGEILHNMVLNGVQPVIIEDEIIHLYHERGGVYDTTYTKTGYKNGDNWGLFDAGFYPIQNNVKMLKISYEEDEIAKYYNKEDKLIIFDIGACDCDSSIGFARMFPNAEINAFEPRQDNFELCLGNIYLKQPNAKILVHSCALSDIDGWSDFYFSSGKPPHISDDNYTNYGNKSSSLLPPKEHLKIHEWCKFDTKIQVQTMRLDTWCKTYPKDHIDFIHMDVQGAELKVLQGAGDFIYRIRGIFLEVSNIEMYEGQALRPEIEEFLSSKGFVKKFDTCIPCVPSGDQLWLRE